MNVIEKARELGKALQQCDEYKAMLEAKNRNDKNVELQEKISNFNLKKIALNHEVTREERDSTKISKLDREMREAYQIVMDDPDMKAYSDAKKKLDVVMKKIEFLLGKTLNGEEPETAEIPESLGCSGNCSDCGGGCH